MMPELRTEVDDREIREAIERLRGRTLRGGMRGVLSSIGAYGKSSTLLRFRAQVGPDGRAWPKSARAKAQGGQTLRDSGRMRNSISWSADADGVEWGTNVQYAAVHQFGYYKARQRVSGHVRLVNQAFGRKLRFGVYQRVSPFARRMKIPARPFLGVNEADRRAILAILAEDLERASAPR